MATRRRELLTRLTEAASGAAAPDGWSDCASLCFQAMYGLPWEIQLGAACFMSARYRPVFEVKHPGVLWVRALLDDVPGWYGEHGRAVPDEPEALDAADAAYLFCFDALLYAYHYRGDQAALTAASCCAISHAAQAKALNVWIADDPESALLQEKIMEIGRTGEPYPESGPFSAERLFAPEHQPHNNAAYGAVARREWASAADRLCTEAVVEQPEPEDRSAVSRALDRWNAHACLLMKPEGM